MEQSKFILEVQSRPCLWNPGVESYLDRVLKRQAWEEVAAKSYQNFDNFSDDEKREAVLELQKNWKSLTDFYKRRNRREDIDEKTKRLKPIVELLHFLDNVTKFEQEIRPKRRSAKQTIKIKNTNVIFQIPKYKKTFKQYERKPELSDEHQHYEFSKLENDSNMNFLQSLLPDMQSLDDRQKFEFKLGVMKLIKKIKYDRKVDNISNDTNVSQQDNMSCDRSTTSLENSPRSLSPLNFSIDCNGKQLVTAINEPGLKLISEPDLDLNTEIIVIPTNTDTPSL